ncbi:hypothetical protein NDU88_002374 [Pleurodeles waltl]|uniref:Uncharacterized protein n=1 Tax=Pleurodeles waltl TaxID=8319 RepID=A0AAV7KRZ5_PLEWA|nr:hypothetical protein NDU88_002374 [Pleurodeles waltl]
MGAAAPVVETRSIHGKTLCNWANLLLPRSAPHQLSASTPTTGAVVSATRFSSSSTSVIRPTRPICSCTSSLTQPRPAPARGPAIWSLPFHLPLPMPASAQGLAGYVGACWGLRQTRDPEEDVVDSEHLAEQSHPHKVTQAR